MVTKKNTQKAIIKNIAAVHGWKLEQNYGSLIIWSRPNNKGKNKLMRAAFKSGEDFMYGHYINYGKYITYFSWRDFITRMIKQ